MKPLPTGQVIRTPKGSDLVLTRTLRAPIEDVWASVTESERTARWFGPWEGEGAPGNTVKLQMVHEEGQPWCDLQIDACDAPNRLAVSMVDGSGTWRMEALLTETDGVTELQLVQHLAADQNITGSGPGWEYYLDMLIASRDGKPLPNFDDYYPAQEPYYQNL
ncbi:MAG: SRPBCC family protein, partial [Kibdelosporangium sp.]